MPLPQSPIGFDSTVLINFGEAGCFGLLIQAVEPPRFILREAELELLSPLTRQAVANCLNLGDLTVCELEPDELPKWVEFSGRLGAGEAATLAAAKERGWSIALDDRTARRIAAEELGADRVTGTVGILLRAIELDCASRQETQRWLDVMIKNGYWSPVTTLP